MDILQIFFFIILFYLIIRPIYRILKFFYIQRVKGFLINTTPYFSHKTTEIFFINRLKKSDYYFEWGSGGSSLQAANFGIPFTSIDSDPYFIDSVRSSIAKNGFNNNNIFLYRDIGLTIQWGNPLYFSSFFLSKSRKEKFRSYSNFTPKNIPDLILIDGRFRVACALKVYKYMMRRKKWTLCFDDYKKRKYYHVLNDFFLQKKYIGNMAVFSNPKKIDDFLLNNLIKYYELDPR